MRTAAAARLLLHLGLRVDELAAADVDDLGHDRGHRVLAVARKGGQRATAPLPPATAAALHAYLLGRMRRSSNADLSGRPLLAPPAVPGWTRAPCTSWCAAWLGPPPYRPGIGCPRTRCATPRSPSLWMPARRCATSRTSPGTGDPRTTRGYDRSRHSLDRNASYTLTAYLA